MRELINSVLLLLVLSMNGLAQDYIINIERYGLEEGLSHQSVQSIYQDEQGFIWIGTQYGLNRFDGYNFKLFTKEKHGLQTNAINHILHDQGGWMWLINSKFSYHRRPRSIDLFNPLTEEIISLEDKFGEDLPFEVKDLNDFAFSKNGEIAFKTKQNKLIIYTYENGFKVSDIQIDPIELSVFSNHNTIWAFLRKNDNNLRDVIVELDLDGKVLNRYEHDYPFSYNYIAGVDSEDNLWYLLKYWKNHRFEEKREGKIFKIDRNGEESEFLLDNTALVPGSVNLDLPTYGNEHGIFINPKDDFFWLIGRSSFQGFHPPSGWYSDLVAEYNELTQINTVFFDNQNKTWIGTNFGLLAMDLNLNPFKSLAYDPSNSSVLAFRGITEDDQNNIWACIDRGAGWFGKFKKEDKGFETQILGPETSEWGRGYKYGILSDSKGYLWFGSSRDTIITRLNPRDSSFQKIHCWIPGEKRLNVWSFYEDKNGLIWFGTDGGRVGYINQDLDIHFLPSIEELKQSGGCIYQFIEDGNGQVWLASDKGLFSLDVEKKSLNPYRIRDLSFLEQGIYHIHEDVNNTFWLGTNGSGLINWQVDSEIFRQYTKADGLSDNTIYAVYDDNYGNLWLPSNYGIIQFNIETIKSRAFLKKDGISGYEFNRGSHYQTKDGTLIFGGVNGLTAFHPDNFQVDSSFSSPPMVISNFQQFVGAENKLIDKTQDLISNKKIVLEPNDPFFRLEFGLLTYEDVDKIQYAYSIKKDEWVYQKENYVRLSRLPYGSHNLKIKGQASSGQWSPKELLIQVVVLKPFYLQTWFLIFSTVTFFSFLYFIYKRRTAQLIKQKAELEAEVARRTQTITEQAEELKSLERLKSRFFANVSHELRTPLTLMLGPINSLLKRNGKNKTDRKLLEYVYRNGEQLMKLTNEILDLSKLEANKLELVEEPVHLKDYLENTTAQFHSFGDSKKVHFIAVNNFDLDLVLLLDKSKFEKIVHNFLSNALKFTPEGGEVKLLVEELENHMQISVKDTGKGIHEDDLPHIFDRFYQSKKDQSLEQGGTGIGLSLCRELAELFNGRVWAESVWGKGSTFYFEFPKKPAKVEELSNAERDTIINVEEQIGTIVQKKNKELAKTESEASQYKNTQILIVEDNLDLRNYLEFLLSDYKVETAENGKVALDNYLSSQKVPDLIITDLMMPVMDGLEFIERIKAEDQTRHIPVIMLTAKVNMDAKLTAFRIGIDDYLHKPFKEEELIARVNNLLNNYRERMQFFQQNGNVDQIESGEKPIMAEADLEWLKEVEEIIQKNLSDSQLTVNFVASELNISPRQISRRLKQLTGLNPRSYLQEMRLQAAKEILLRGRYTTVKQTAYAVGYKDIRYFSQQFHERFGRIPSSYINK